MSLAFVTIFRVKRCTMRIFGGRFFDRARFDTPGQLHYAHPVAPEFLNRHGENRVAIDPEPVWVSKADGGKLGFIISRAGFAE